LTDGLRFSELELTETEEIAVLSFEEELCSYAEDFYLETRFLEDMQLFKTARGHIGYARAGVREGDVVCLLNGSPVFHILRRGNDRSKGVHRKRYETYRLVGDAYVYGWMNGETEDMDVEERDIVLV
jgi:hypothetical protein